MEELFKSKDEEISKLLAENRELSDELRQCQADKEFVWSLWKRLQVSSPDLTQAISLVLQREKEKAEAKDAKVLEILETKDQQIADLQETARSLKSNCDRVVEEKEAAENARKAQDAKCQALETQITLSQQSAVKLDADNEKQLIRAQQALKDSEKEREKLSDQVTNLLIEIQQSRTKLQNYEEKRDELEAKIAQYENELKDRDAVLQRLGVEKQRLATDLDSLNSERDQIKSSKRLESKYKELKEAYEQLKSHCQQQKQLIVQLQELHSSTQKVLKEQQETHKHGTNSLQSMYDELVKEYDKLKQAHHSLQQESTELRDRVHLQEEAIQATGQELRKSIEMASRRDRKADYREVDDLEDEVTAQRNEIEMLRRKLRDQDNRKRRSRSPHDNDVDQTFSPIIERGVQRNAPKSRSLSPCRQGKHMVTLQKRLKATETRLDETKRLLELKRDEVRDIQDAHNRRLERFKALQSDYRALKSNADDPLATTKRRRHRPSRSDRRDRRQETSETVWNDLAFFKQENKALAEEKLMLEDVVDNLRVQSSMDRATIQDLNVCLKNEKEELLARIRPSTRVEDRLSSTPKKVTNRSPSREAKPTRRAMKNVERRLENATEDNRLLKKDRDRLLEDNRGLKGEIKSLKREITESRQTGTTLRKENSDLRVKLQLVDGDKEHNSQEISALRVEIQGLRAESAGVRSENSSLRSENSDLRQDIADHKQELSELKLELRHIDRAISSAEQQRKSGRQTGRRSKSDVTKKHRKFLNRSISEMRAAFGENFDAEDPSTTVTESVYEDEGPGPRSDASSLGQSIVRASRRTNDIDDDEDDDDIDDDDDDTVVEQETAAKKSSKRMVAGKRAPVLRYGVTDRGMHANMKHRLASLQTQCATLRNAKQNVVKRMTELKEKNDELQSELATCQNKLKNSKQTIQRMTRENELLVREKEELQREVEETRSSQPQPQKHSDADYKYVESKLKMANSETSRFTEQVRDLKKEIETKNEQVSADKDRLSRMERDIAMKRQLIDELRVKVRENETKNNDDRHETLDLRDRLKQTEEDLNHKKSHVESLRRQLQACTKEKSRYETMYNKSRQELDKRCGELTAMQASRLEAETATSKVEEAAEHQLQALANRSEQALDLLKNKLDRSEEKLREFATFVKSLSGNLVELLVHKRDTLLRDKMAHIENEEGDAGLKTSSSLSRAQTVACNILNISRSDFEDLMAPVDSMRRSKNERDSFTEERTVATKADHVWKNKVEKIANENPPFAKSLGRLIWDKIQDAVKLTEDRYRLQTEHLEGQLEARKS